MSAWAAVWLETPSTRMHHRLPLRVEFVRQWSVEDDREIQAKVVGAAYPHLVGALALAVGDVAVAEDLAQEAIVRFLSKWDATRSLDNPAAWLYRVGLNLARSRWRRAAAERRSLTRAGPPRESRDHDGADAVALWGALDTLTARQRQAIVGRYYLNMTPAEIAEAIGCRHSTAKAHLRDGLASLRTLGLGTHDDLEVPTP